MPPQRGPHWAMRRWCRGRHQRYPQNTPAETLRQTQPSDPRPSRSCQRSAARRRGQCPKPRRIAIAVGAQRRGIDGAEHSAKIKRVMAGGSSDQGGGISPRKRAGESRVLPAGIALRMCPESSRASRADSQWHARRERPPLERPRGQLAGSGWGSLTSRSRYYPPTRAAQSAALPSAPALELASARLDAAES